MSINKPLFFGALLVCICFGADQASEAEYDDDEQQICNNTQYSFAAIVNGERRVIPYSIVDGQAVVEGDIVIGQEGDFPIAGASYVAPVKPPFLQNGQPTRWAKSPSGDYIVPFKLDSSLTDRARAYIRDATIEWEKRTAVRFRQIGDDKDWKRSNYMKFKDNGKPEDKGGGCWSNRIGVHEKSPNSGREEDNINVIQVSPGCSWGRVAHEIAHALGLFHEQSRADRDKYVTIMWKNIMNYPEGDKDHWRKQYCKALFRKEGGVGGETLPNTSYDYDSIMHYPLDGFAKPHCDSPATEVNGKCLAMVPNQQRLKEQERLLGRMIDPGQRDHLSEGDIWLVNYLYPPEKPPPPTQQSCVTISTKTTVTDRNGTTTSTTTTTTSGNCAPDGHTHKHGKPHDHEQWCPVACCWPPDRRCCHPDWCPPRRHAMRPWHFPPPPFHRTWWPDDFRPRSHFDDWDYW